MRSFLRLLLDLARNNEVIVFTVASPRPRRHIAHFHKLPIDYVCWSQAEIVAHGGGNAESSAMIRVWSWTLTSKNILPIICGKRAAILPLRKTGSIAFANGNPAMPAHRFSRPRIGLFEPRNH